MLHRERSLRGLAFALVPAAALLSACGSGDATATKASAEASAEAAHAIAELSIDEVEARLAKNDGNFFVYDCNQRSMFDAGHVPGAKFLDYKNLKESDLTPNKDATLVFYCSNEH